METKYCPRKQHEVPVSEFGLCKSNKDGLQKWCKTCRKDYRTENRESLLSKGKKYRESRSPEQLEASRNYFKNYWTRNREELLAKAAIRREVNKDRYSSNKSKWYNENKESINASRREKQSNWTEEQKENKRLADIALYNRNKTPYLERSRERRALLNNAIVPGEPLPTIEYLKWRDGDHCFYCGCMLDFISRPKKDEPDNHVHLEHLTPLTRGGLHIRENTVLSCKKDNLSKNNKTLEEYIQLTNSKNQKRELL